MLTMAMVAAVVAAMVFVMRMDDDPTRWQARWDGAGAGSDAAAARAAGDPAAASVSVPGSAGD